MLQSSLNSCIFGYASPKDDSKSDAIHITFGAISHRQGRNTDVPRVTPVLYEKQVPHSPGLLRETEEIPPGGQLVKEESFFFFSQLEAHTIQGTPRTLP